MRISFSPDANKLTVPVTVTGPRDEYEFHFTLDTGSKRTVVPAAFLRPLGIDPSRPVGHARLRTALGIARAPLVRVPSITALGQTRTDLLAAAHDFPRGVETDGLLVLDFFRGFVLTIDFARGRITLARRRWWQFWR